MLSSEELKDTGDIRPSCETYLMHQQERWGHGVLVVFLAGRMSQSPG